MDNKKKYGQFFTTNYKYILSNMTIPDNISLIVEPFVGNKDLLAFIDNKEKYVIEMYDIEPKHDDVIKRDTLLNPLDYNNKYVITNPPYLARNKSNDKSIFDKYKMNDLYKCFLMQLINCENHIGGILIIPLNFFCSIRIADINLRKKFLSKYHISKLNIFEEQVFDDTSYTICSFQYQNKQNKQNNDNLLKNINVSIYKKGTSINDFIIELNNKNNYTFGGEIYLLK